MNDKEIIRQLTEAIRRVSTPPKSEREPCAVCDRFARLTDAHHIVSVSELAHAARRGYIIFAAPVVWLCPNCHAWAHRLNVQDPDLFDAYTTEQINRLGALVEMRRKWIDELYASFPNMQGDMHLSHPLTLGQQGFFDAIVFQERVRFETVGYAIRFVLEQANKP